MVSHESKDVRGLTSFCQHLSDVALWDGWHLLPFIPGGIAASFAWV